MHKVYIGGYAIVGIKRIPTCLPTYLLSWLAMIHTYQHNTAKTQLPLFYGKLNVHGILGAR